ncbi:hypothetical protein KAU34_05820, partial [candidate division WOR-3 bacterium]|nr:hypothetical protein [candidate division WOR-3 bacterium]
NEGWIGKTHGEIVHTTDGGTSWLTDSTPTTEHINDIFFSDPDHGWAVGEGGIVMAYNQGSWIQEPCAPSAYAKFSIKQNPFRDKVTMLISVSYGTPVSLKVYNLEGRLIGTVLSGFYSPGTYEVKWDARDARGEEIPSGTYFAILRVGSEISVKKVVHLR